MSLLVRRALGLGGLALALFAVACGSAGSSAASNGGAGGGGAAVSGQCQPREYATAARPADIVLIADDSTSATVLRDRTREALIAVVAAAEPGDRITAFWMNRPDPWVSVTVPLPNADENVPIPAPLPTATSGGPAVGEGRTSEQLRQERNAYFAAVTRRCQAEQRYTARLEQWRTGVADSIRKNDPPPINSTPLFEAISRASLALQSNRDAGTRVLVIAGDAEPYGRLTRVRDGSLDGVHVVMAPFRPSETQDWDEARGIIETWLRPARARSTEFISADRPPSALSEHVAKLRRSAG